MDEVPDHLATVAKNDLARAPVGIVEARVSGRDHGFEFDAHPGNDVVGEAQTESPAQIRRIAFERALVAAESALLVVEMKATKDPDLVRLIYGRFVGGCLAWRAGLGGQRPRGCDPGQGCQQPCGQDTRLQQHRVCSTLHAIPSFSRTRLSGSRAALASAHDAEASCFSNRRTVRCATIDCASTVRCVFPFKHFLRAAGLLPLPVGAPGVSTGFQDPRATT